MHTYTLHTLTQVKGKKRNSCSQKTQSHRTERCLEYCDMDGRYSPRPSPALLARKGLTVTRRKSGSSLWSHVLLVCLLSSQ